MSDFGNRLLEALSFAGKKRQWLADHLGVDVASVTQTINGTSKSMNARNAALTARALGVDFIWLCTGEGEMADIQSSQWREVARSLATAMDAAERGQRYALFVRQVDELVERAKLDAAAARKTSGAPIDT